MRFVKAIILSTVTACAGSCGPGAVDETLRGELVYTDSVVEVYQLDRRVELVAVDALGRDGCGFLTNRAVEDLETTIRALDPRTDYAVDPMVCQTSTEIHLEGFEHSPFQCDWMCCHRDLAPVALVYFAVISTVYDKPPNIDGEIYVALEPDRPCE